MLQSIESESKGIRLESITFSSLSITPDHLSPSLPSRGCPDGVGPASRDYSMPILPAEPDMFPEDLWDGVD